MSHWEDAINAGMQGVIAGDSIDDFDLGVLRADMETALTAALPALRLHVLREELERLEGDLRRDAMYAPVVATYIRARVAELEGQKQ